MVAVQVIAAETDAAAPTAVHHAATAVSAANSKPASRTVAPSRFHEAAMAGP